MSYSAATAPAVADRARILAPLVWLVGKVQSGKTSIIRTLTEVTHAEIGAGFRACTRSARIFGFPVEAPIIRFLDTRGLGEAAYDPSDAPGADPYRQPAALRRMGSTLRSDGGLARQIAIDPGRHASDPRRARLCSGRHRARSHRRRGDALQRSCLVGEDHRSGAGAAQRARLLRALSDIQNASAWSSLWSQAANAGRVIKDTFLSRSTAP